VSAGTAGYDETEQGQYYFDKLYLWAGIVLYFASDDANYTTGQCINVDGSWTCGLSGDY